MNPSIDRNLPYQRIALLLTGIIAFLMRFVLLGKLPLTDSEAVNALQALGGGRFIGGEGGYVLLTSVWFFIFGAGDAVARFWPALAGTALALTPWLFRKHLGEKTALLLCFGLAIDAGWVAVSRQANGMSWAGLWVLLTLAALLNKKPALLGLFAGLALLGGPAFWQGAVGLGFATVLYRFVFQPRQPVEEGVKGTFDDFDWKAASGWFIGVVLVAGTALFLIPDGLNSIANGLVQYLTGWSQASTVTAGRMLLGLVLSQPLGFLFAAVGLVRVVQMKNPLDTFLAVWWLAALALALFYPAREIADLGWVLLPMLALAASQLAKLLTTAISFRWTAIAYSIIVGVLLTFSWLSFIAYFRADRPEVSTFVRMAGTLFPVLLLVGAAFVIRWFWDEETAGQGAMWGLIAALGLWGFAAAWGGTGLGANPEGQVWRRGAWVDEVDLLQTTLNDLSTWKMRVPGELELVVEGIDSPALRWALRDYRQTRFVTTTASSSTPALLITADKPSPELADTYRGQDFVLEVTPIWQLSFKDWLKWIAFKSIPVEKTIVILWARADLFPDAPGFNP
ncbi:MAG: hypothetical protein C0396_04695 [Anaerolinea sp.]|nr:hypothetical protein [Anaerolinea sp.]